MSAKQEAHAFLVLRGHKPNNPPDVFDVQFAQYLARCERTAAAKREGDVRKCAEILRQRRGFE